MVGGTYPAGVVYAFGTSGKLTFGSLCGKSELVGRGGFPGCSIWLASGQEVEERAPSPRLP